MSRWRPPTCAGKRAGRRGSDEIRSGRLWQPGDIEPCAAVGRELLRRGHEVRMAVPPNMFGFVESVGLAPVAYGPDPPALLHDTDSVGGKAANPINMLPDVIEHVIQLWVEMGTTLMSLADGPTCCWRAPTSRRSPPTSWTTTAFRWPHCTASRCGSSFQFCSRRTGGWIGR
ncbi:glycosyltransferase family 28 N-terminal domain protein [Mycobacterium xenopi 3993]|nr:glycosyltransferase family 28 N-terminal domain protein [Mycobacterium xenopi 3993]